MVNIQKQIELQIINIKTNLMYSQNLEENSIVEFFKGFQGSLLSIGENDGKTFSNSLRLIELGWDAVLVEPSPKAFEKLAQLHLENENVMLCQLAIGVINGRATLHESGAHVKGGNDLSLVSSLSESETDRWKKSGVEFSECDVPVFNYKTFTDEIKVKHFDFITIDAEGMDIAILKQIDLLNVKLLCIEWNSIDENKKEILEYTSTFGMNKIMYQSGENLLICR